MSVSSSSPTPPITQLTFGAVDPHKYEINDQGELNIGGKLYKITHLDGKNLTGSPLSNDQKLAINALINKVFTNALSANFNKPNLETIKITKVHDTQVEVEGFQASKTLFKEKVDVREPLTPQFTKIKEVFKHSLIPNTLPGKFVDPQLNPFMGPTIKLPVNMTKADIEIHKIPADGDCQMHAILKVLKDRYPSHPQISKWNAADLRQIGVDFAKRNLNIEPYKKTLSDHIGADINDFNERLAGYKECKLLYTNKLKALNNQIKNIKNQPGPLDMEQSRLQRERLQKLEAERLDILSEEEKELARIVKEKNGIKDIPEYLDRVAKNGFWCGAMHLYALSFALNVPIHVYQEEFLPTSRPAQQFNATVPGNAINLIRVNQSHYEVIIGPKHI